MNLNFMDICPTSSETSGKIEWWVEGGYHVLDDTDVLYVTTYYHDIALDYIWASSTELCEKRLVTNTWNVEG